MCLEAFKDVLSLFQNRFAFCVYVGKYDFSFAIVFCLTSHKGLDREKNVSKNISEILIYFHERCLHNFISIILSFHRVYFS